MAQFKRRRGKPLRFVAVPLPDDHPCWLDLDRQLPPDHLARRIRALVEGSRRWSCGTATCGNTEGCSSCTATGRGKRRARWGCWCWLTMASLCSRHETTARPPLQLPPLQLPHQRSGGAPFPHSRLIRSGQVGIKRDVLFRAGRRRYVVLGSPDLNRTSCDTRWRSSSWRGSARP